MPQPKKQPPIQTFLNGTAKGNVWMNDTTKGQIPSITFENLYKKEDGKWSSTNSFPASQLPNLAQSALEARRFVLDLQSEERKQASESTDTAEAA